MANSAYTGEDQTMQRFCPNDQNVQHWDSSYFIEPDTRWNLSQQTPLSQAHRRYDSLADSPAVPLRFPGSPHQAEPQPRRNATAGISTATGYLGSPLNNYTTRSASHQSSLPRTQSQHYYNMHQGGYDSFDSNTPANMVRSYSGTPESLDNVHQVRQVSTSLSPANWHPSPSSNLSQDVEHERTYNVIKNSYEFDPDEIIGSGSVRGNGNEEHHLGLETCANIPTSSFPSWSTNVGRSAGSSSRRGRVGQSTPKARHVNRTDISPCAEHCNSLDGSSTVTPSPQPAALDHTSAPETTEDDSVVGQVTLSGIFTCLHKACRDDETLTFNRHADFKRHYANMHGKRIVEYFCSERGCPRSKHPADGRKGRSFKARRDKMKEHMESVHGKYEAKRKRK